MIHIMSGNRVVICHFTGDVSGKVKSQFLLLIIQKNQKSYIFYQLVSFVLFISAKWWRLICSTVRFLSRDNLFLTPSHSSLFSSLWNGLYHAAKIDIDKMPLLSNVTIIIQRSILVLRIVFRFFSPFTTTQ